MWKRAAGAVVYVSVRFVRSLLPMAREALTRSGKRWAGFASAEGHGERMRVGGLIVIVGGVLALAAFLCLPYATHGHVALTGADIALALTSAARHYRYWRAAAVPALVAWWWVWWLVPVLAAVAVGLGITMLASGPRTDKASRRLYAAGAIEAGLIGVLVLVGLGLLLYAPAVLRNGSTCLWCDAEAGFGLAQRLAGTGFWATLDALLVVVVGGAFALVWIATERPQQPPPKRRMLRPRVELRAKQEQSPAKEKPGASPAPQPQPGQRPQPATEATNSAPEATKTQPPGRAPASAQQHSTPADPKAPKGWRRYLHRD